MLRDVVPKMYIVQSNRAEDFGSRARTVTVAARSTDRVFEARPSETSLFVLSGVVSIADAERGAAVRVPASAAGGRVIPRFWAAKRAADALARTGTE